MLKVGDQAPLDVTVLDMQKQPVSLTDFAGKYVVLYFYPKDDTEACTKEACSFRDANDDLKALGVEVIGVSKDTVRSHAKFMEKFQLKFHLWSDRDQALMKAFDVWIEKTMFGKKYMGTARATFIISPQGKILEVLYEDIKAEEHATKALAFLKDIIGKN